MKTRPQSRLERRDAELGRRTLAVLLEQKAVGDDGVIEGYGSVFNVIDDWGDIVAPGAFKASLQAHAAAGTMPAMLWQHRDSDPIGVWTEMVEDAKGLRIKGRLVMESSRGKEAHALLKAGAINGLSIGFVKRKWTYDEGAETRTLTEVDLWEVSPVTFPANVHARVDTVKSVGAISTVREAERALRDAGLSAEQAKAVLASVKRAVQAERDAEQDEQRALRAAQKLLITLQS